MMHIRSLRVRMIVFLVALLGVVQIAEFVAVGALAGLMAAIGAQVIGWVLATHVFEFYLTFDPWLLPAGIAAG